MTACTIRLARGQEHQGDRRQADARCSDCPPPQPPAVALPSRHVRSLKLAAVVIRALGSCGRKQACEGGMGVAGPAAIRPECANCTHAPAPPYTTRIACCRRGHDGKRGRPDDTAFAVFQEAVTAHGRRNGRLPASCISLRVKIPRPTWREAVGVEPSRPAGIPWRLGRGRRGIWSAATNGQACLRRYLHDVLACSSTNRRIGAGQPASRLNQKLLMKACKMARRSRKFRLNSALRNKSRPAAIRRRPRKPCRVVP